MCTTTNEETTSTETQEEVTTGVEGFPRDINVLLALDTYQGMTDEEIELVFTYKINQSLTSRENLAKIEALNQTMESKIEIQRQSCATTENMLQSLIIATIPNYEIVQPNTVSPQSIGV